MVSEGKMKLTSLVGDLPEEGYSGLGSLFFFFHEEQTSSRH